MAAAMRRAVQNQGAQQLQASQSALSISRPVVASSASSSSSDLIVAEGSRQQRLLLPVSLSSSVVLPQEWLCLQDRRSSSLSSESSYSCGLTTPPSKAWNYATVRGYYMRNISQLVATANGHRAFLVDTLALVLL